MSRTGTERKRERGEWIERAESIGPALAELSVESTRLRTMCPSAVAALEDAGMFAMAAPLEVGGFDVHPASQVEVFETLASYDMSAGWVAFIQTESAASLGAKVPDGPGLQTIFADGIPRAVGLINPQGEARPANGGYRVSGKWNFGSGVRHCTWIIGASHLFDADGMGLDPQRVREIVKVSQEPVSLETPIGEEDDSHLGDFVEDEKMIAPDAAAGQQLLKETVNAVLHSLSIRERKVLELRFGLTDGRSRTLEEVGREFEVTRERIRQIEAKALRRLRHPLRATRLRDYIE